MARRTEFILSQAVSELLMFGVYLGVLKIRVIDMELGTELFSLLMPSELKVSFLSERIWEPWHS